MFGLLLLNITFTSERNRYNSYVNVAVRKPAKKFTHWEDISVRRFLPLTVKLRA